MPSSARVRAVPPPPPPPLHPLLLRKIIRRRRGAQPQGSFLLEQWRNLYALMHHREEMPPAWVAVVRRVLVPRRGAAFVAPTAVCTGGVYGRALAAVGGVARLESGRKRL